MAFDTVWSGGEAGKLYLTSGEFESTLKTSEDISGIDSTIQGISYNYNTLWNGLEADKLYLTSGTFESTLKTSESIGGIDVWCRGVSTDGTNTLWSGDFSNKLYLTSGIFESTLKTSEDVSGISGYPRGISFDGTNTLWAAEVDNKLFLTSGEFESTLKTSEDVGSIDNVVKGISFNGINTLWTGEQAGKLYLTSGEFESTLKTSEDISGVDTNPKDIGTTDYYGRLYGPMFPGQLEAITSMMMDIEIIVPVAFGATSSLSAEYFAGASIDCSDGFSATASLDADCEISTDVSLDAQADLSTDPTFEITDCSLSATSSIYALPIDTFSISGANRVYIFTLTGAADGVSDIEIPISSFQSRVKSGEPTYVSVVIPGTDYLSSINARTNGELVIRMGYKEGDTILFSEIIARADFDTIRYDEGTDSSSITLEGYMTTTYSPKTVALENVSYKNITGGLLRFRCTPNMYLRPGDTAEYGDDSFTVDSINYSVSVGQEQYEVAE